MNVIGVSGIEQARGFKEAHWPGLEERMYRMCQGYDSAAALVMNGEIVAAAEEERFNRKKHSAAFPVLAIHDCLKQAGISLDQVDQIAHAFDYEPCRSAYAVAPMAVARFQEAYSHEAFRALVSRDLPGFPLDRVHHVNHHLAHAASAYFTSGWDECLVIVIDGMGEVHGASVYHARDGKLTSLQHISALDSIGILYSLVTLHLGFDFNSDEYKIMGLAPYGDPTRYSAFFADAVKLTPAGRIKIPMLRMNKTRDDQENFVVSRRYLDEHLIKARQPDSDITQDHRDIAAALQACLDDTMLHLCGHFGKKTGLRRLAMAGGVALNCTANGKLLRSGLFDDIYVQPAAGDDGAAIGAALYQSSVVGKLRNRRSPVPFLGPSHSMEAVDEAISAFKESVEVVRFKSLEDTCAEAARLIAEGKVAAWYRGRMEFGPRALGHRSIIADPGHSEMRDRRAGISVHDHDRRCAPAVSCRAAGHHACQRVRAPPNCVPERQSGISRAPEGGRENNGTGDAAEYQFQRQGTADRQHTV
ncbi:MAG: carbamoyltransferase [Nitrospirae bacterium]|nr:carbamoyltransferase [Nitrospirota bacterium]